MQRYADFKDISDGRLYGLNDMVKADCHDCRDCSKCCSQDMGDTITIDPLDMFRLTKGLGRSFDSLIHKELEISLSDGIMLPHMRMSGLSEPIYEKDSDMPTVYKIPVGCQFLDKNGRCTIHEYRPGICRLFPLGRIYENGDFKYFLQINECSMKNRTKVKVSKWIDTENLKEYERFVKMWHNFLLMAAKKLREEEDTDKVKMFHMAFLTKFYAEEYQSSDELMFYTEFDGRMKEMVKLLRKM